MKAAVVNNDPTRSPVSVREVPVPRPRPHWVTVRLRNAALNRLDAMQLQRRSDQPDGVTHGADGAGVLSELGSEIQQRPGLSLGDPVIISPSLFWGASPFAPGDDYQILGSTTNGTHAEYVTVPAANVYAKPQHLTFEEAAALPLAGVTAWRATMTRGRLKAGETLVIGAASSGVGALAIQIGAAVGARVIAVTSSEGKAAVARKLGAVATIDRSRGNLAAQILAHTDGGADLALDPTGALWQTFVDSLRPGGRLVSVGKIAAEIGDLRVQSVYWKQIDLLGSSMGSPRDFEALLEHVTRHGWAPWIDSVHSLDDVASAYERLDDTRRIGKVVLDVGTA